MARGKRSVFAWLPSHIVGSASPSLVVLLPVFINSGASHDRIHHHMLCAHWHMDWSQCGQAAGSGVMACLITPRASTPHASTPRRTTAKELLAQLEAAHVAYQALEQKHTTLCAEIARLRENAAAKHYVPPTSGYREACERARALALRSGRSVKVGG